MKRYSNLVTWTVFVLGLLAFVAGCSDSGPTWAEIESGGDDGDATVEEMTASSLADGRRGIGISFPEAIPASLPEASLSKAEAVTLTRAQMEALLSVKDAQGREKQINSVIWAADGMSAKVFGEFPYCAALTIEGKAMNPDGSDFEATVLMPKNRKDIDGDCTADSPIYDKVLQIIFGFMGEEVLDLSQPKPYALNLADLDPADYWSVVGINAAGNRGVVNLGLTDSSGLGVFSATNDDTNKIQLWKGLDSENPAAIWNLKIGEIAGTNLGPPFSVGDINGDAFMDYAFADFLVDAEGEVVIDPDSGKPIPAYYYVLGGADPSQFDYAWQAADLTFVLEGPGPKTCGVALGNFNGDVSAGGYPMGDIAVCLKYTSYQEILIAYGAETLTDVESMGQSSIVNVSSFGMNKIAGGDFDGNGVADIAVALTDNTAQTGELRLFLNEAASADSIGDISMAAGAAKISDDFKYVSDVNDVYSPGDINSDGMADLVLFSFYLDEMGYTVPIAYVFYGREDWSGDLGVANADIVIDSGIPNTDFKFDAVLDMGDLDNDGYDELEVSAVEMGTEYWYIYRGRPLMKKSLDMKDDPSAIVRFTGK
jgi:hypothetical protein